MVSRSSNNKPHPFQIGERLEVFEEVRLAADDQFALVALAARPACKTGGNDLLRQFVEFGLALLEPLLDLALDARQAYGRECAR